MATHDIIVVGASAGGVEVLTKLVSGFSARLPASVFIVVHVPPFARSVLPDILSRAGPLPVAHARSDEAVRPGHIYVAPPDRHLVLEAGRVYLSSGPRENRVRPAIDTLFRTAAISYGARVVGVVLSGTLSDGTAGLYEIKQRGGIAIVQDPKDALFPDMPKNALDQVPIDYVLPASKIADILTTLADQPLEDDEGGSKDMAPDERPGAEVVADDIVNEIDGRRNGELAIYTCPECSGALWQVNAGKVVRFTCHVGHVYTGDDLLEGYSEVLERSLWHAARTLRDRANLMQQLANVARERGSRKTAARYEEETRTDSEHAEVIERMIAGGAIVDEPN
ncbi:MAG TPA: chemotaxis protein CheB [Capsulimonadaceae bacterium]|nr:chemotaxis protein CheB [Capsulimonadaceae bacterium]